LARGSTACEVGILNVYRGCSANGPGGSSTTVAESELSATGAGELTAMLGRIISGSAEGEGDAVDSTESEGSGVADGSVLGVGSGVAVASTVSGAALSSSAIVGAIVATINPAHTRATNLEKILVDRFSEFKKWKIRARRRLKNSSKDIFQIYR
jgi:hypothetical protein